MQSCAAFNVAEAFCVDISCVMEQFSDPINRLYLLTIPIDQAADYLLAQCGKVYEDNDGFTAANDCNDNDASIYPGAPEICDDGIDQDCNGSDAICGDLDGDGFMAISSGGEDCNDNNAQVYPGAEEICDGFDNDCDGIVDNISENLPARPGASGVEPP